MKYTARIELSFKGKKPKTIQVRFDSNGRNIDDDLENHLNRNYKGAEILILSVSQEHKRKLTKFDEAA